MNVMASEWRPEGRRRPVQPKTTWRRMVEDKRRAAGWQLWMTVRALATKQSEWQENVKVLCSLSHKEIKRCRLRDREYWGWWVGLGNIWPRMILSVSETFLLFHVSVIVTAFFLDSLKLSSCGRRGGLMVSALDPERVVRVRALAGDSVFGQDTLLSQCLSPPRCINGYRQTYR